MANPPEHHPMTRADYDAYAMRAFRESLEQARKALRDTDHIVSPGRAKPVHPDQHKEPPKGPKKQF